MMIPFRKLQRDVPDVVCKLTVTGSSSPVVLRTSLLGRSRATQSENETRIANGSAKSWMSRKMCAILSICVSLISELFGSSSPLSSRLHSYRICDYRTVSSHISSRGLSDVAIRRIENLATGIT